MRTRRRPSRSIRDVAIGTIEDALALWRGPALADLADQPSLLAEAARLDELRIEAQEDRIEGLLASGRARPGASGSWRRCWHGIRCGSACGVSPCSPATGSGRQAEALAAYQRAREILADELGIDPSPELVRLHERVLQQDPGLDLRGEPLRGYRLLEKIDDGPTGVVFRAIQPHVERDVAVKIVPRRNRGRPRVRPSVRAGRPGRRRPGASAHRPRSTTTGGSPVAPTSCLATCAAGASRAPRGAGEPLERDRAFGSVEQIARALAFAHRQGIAHGNVGPSNVLFDPEGNAYLGDFLIGGGPAADPAEDVRELARLAGRLLPNETRPSQSLAERVEPGRT